MTRPFARRAAFTLVEMLVVIFIIAALAAMLIVGIGSAIKASHNYAMKMEVSQLAQAVEAYKQAMGDYPPSFKENYSMATRTNTVAWRHTVRCFPKMTAANRNSFFDLLAANPGLTGAEGLVFWLSRTGSDLQAPFGNLTYPSTVTIDYKVYFPFDERRLITTVAPFAGYKAKYAKDTVYAYFDGRTYHLEDGAVGAKPYYKTQPKMGAVPTEGINATTFQIICAGLDGEFGNGVMGKRKAFPYGVAGLPEDCSEGDSDNITNFGDGKLLKDLLQ